MTTHKTRGSMPLPYNIIFKRYPNDRIYYQQSLYRWG